MTVIHVDFGNRRAQPGSHVIPAEFLATQWRYVTWMYWTASRAAIASYRRGRPECTAVLLLRDIHLCPLSYRLKCAAGGALVTIRAEHLVDDWGASA